MEYTNFINDSEHTHKPLRGADTEVGEILIGSTNIFYDIGDNAGNYAESQSNSILSKVCSIRGMDVQVSLNTENELIVTFVKDSANFVTTINNHEDILNIILMFVK